MHIVRITNDQEHKVIELPFLYDWKAYQMFSMIQPYLATGFRMLLLDRKGEEQEEIIKKFEPVTQPMPI